MGGRLAGRSGVKRGGLRKGANAMPEAPNIGPLSVEKRASELGALRRRHAAIRANCDRQSRAAREMRTLAAEARDRLRRSRTGW